MTRPAITAARHTKIALGEGLTLDLEALIPSRLLVQANSGGGKSWAIRRLLEQTHGHVQQIVLDPEGEFSSLREKHDYILAQWMRQTSKAERSILEALAAEAPRSMSVEEIAEATNYEAGGGGFRNAIGRLRTLEVIRGGLRGEPVTLADELR